MFLSWYPFLDGSKGDQNEDQHVCSMGMCLFIYLVMYMCMCSTELHPQAGAQCHGRVRVWDSARAGAKRQKLLCCYYFLCVCVCVFGFWREGQTLFPFWIFFGGGTEKAGENARGAVETTEGLFRVQVPQLALAPLRVA